MNLRRAVALAAAAASTLVVLPAASASAAEVWPAPASGAWTVTGRGYGHGAGMSQWGAQSRALAGQDYRRILADYYPGTVVAHRPNRPLRVQLSRLSGPEVFLESPSQAPLAISTSGRTVAPGQRLRVTFENGTLVGAALDGTTELWRETWTSVPTVSSPDGVWVTRADGSGNRFRGTISFPVTTPVTPVNNTWLEDYLLGVVPRESPSWFAQQALRAQSVAARSYALSTLRPQAAWDICDTEACQVYGGSAVRDARRSVSSLESPSTSEAVRATDGEIREHQGQPAFTQFSSSNGGWSTVGSKPYLQAHEDFWSSPAGRAPQDTVASWTAQLPVAAVARSCPNGGQPRFLELVARDGRGEWGGRITSLRVRCTTGDATLTSAAAARFAGTLRSSWWVPQPGGTGAVTDRWRALGGDAGVLGRPTGPHRALSHVEGTYQLFERGSVYWSPASGAASVRGAIRDKWGAMGWENSLLRFPTSDEFGVRGGAGQHFQGGSVYWSPATGAREVHGAIRDAWARQGWELGPLGFPVTDEVRLAGGAVSHFQGGSVYWSPATGAQAVRGAIRDAWARQGWENGRLGYPTSDEYGVPGGRRSDFQGGSITWTPAGGAVVTYR
ncbi:SpoIID/LytB domain protein [Kineococcus xinjiangensis]|uniref:SpoIID/LytB domain protein n=1 Tax=Kineococcus xinjiangensis TaxID=512762 RepID=A0A2S6IUQ3_9ACTN|nr:SpoIID/LytB domain-containing protein [Kineococcus xinjiangensis]PPK97766.1 SpoIID/LytB domain protein [Kineococcus xinjiangensis]